jgi:circadian clock protein KaiC
LTRQQETERRQLELERKRKALEAQIASMRAEFEAQETETLKVIRQERTREVLLAQDSANMGLSRTADKK